ncbi:thiolase family protein [Acidiferrimicrobium sp. IK]|uniref:thiolase family protein n=1 Tax=Acidiferrimicrobium sp. IK TaxID=2871700 RepID=UPI0021CB139B|nr:thiolase family protein [Acidiferrimicrobium sp. IK]MCU4187464.1 thiolase family protein [Acidiferrimicrobium sp. IK]
MIRDVYVIGVGMHPFGAPIVSAADMGFVAGVAALEDAGIAFPEVGALYNGYLGSGLTTGVAMAKDLGLTGLPVNHVENASATGSSAFREAVQAVAGGGCEVAMAIGFDDMNKMSGLGGSGPRVEGVILPAAYFAMWAVRRMHDKGTTIETFAKLAAKNWNHARTNPYAQRQADHEVTVEEVLAATMIAYPHTSKMACASGAGGAAAVVASGEYVERLGAGSRAVKVIASQQQSERYTDGHVFLGAVIGPSEMTQTTAAAAYEEAGLGPGDLSLVQVHDAFPIEELMYYELLGICPEGEGDRLISEGATSLGGRIPFSTDGGLTARGHPGGPTGLAQIHETVTQLRGEAGGRQVEGASVGLAHMCGAGSVCVIHILRRP